MNSSNRSKASKSKSKTEINKVKNPFSDAVESKQYDKIPQLIKDGHNINMGTPPTNSTALHYAAMLNRVPAGQALINADALVDARTQSKLLTSSGQTALHVAASLGHIDFINFLVANKASLESVDDCGFTPLQSAAFILCKKEAVICLLNHGANPTYINPQRKQTASQMALEDNEPEIAAILLEAEKKYEKNKKLSINTKATNIADEKINLTKQTSSIGTSSTADFLIPFLRSTTISHASEIKNFSTGVSSSIAVPAHTTLSQETMDLHGYSSNQASSIVNHFIASAPQAKVEAIRFITGRGNHVNSQGKRGTLFEEFPSWIADENANKIASVRENNGFYEVLIKPAEEKSPMDNAYKALTKEWIISNKDTLRKLAETGDHQAEYFIACCALHAFGQAENLKEAVTFLQKSADGGNAQAQYELGGLYWSGKGVKQNDETAITLFKASAKADFPWAHHQLGDIYCYDMGAKQDLALAFDHYQAASKLDLDIAKRKLAHLLYAKGTSADLEKAFLLYKEVADRGDAHSAFNVANLFYYGQGIKKDLIQAFSYAKKAADKNDPDGQLLLSMFYRFGSGIKNPDPELSLYYLKMSANNNFKHALFELAIHPTVIKNPQERSSCLKRAALAGHVIAEALVLSQNIAVTAAEKETILSSFWAQEDKDVLNINHKKFKLTVIDTYLKIATTKNQKKKIIRIMNTMAEHKDPDIFGRLGRIYVDSHLAKPNLILARDIWKKGAALNDADSCFNLCELYRENRDNFPANTQQSFYWAQQAADAGHPIAKTMLAKYAELVSSGADNTSSSLSKGMRNK